jgi:adenosylcobinamide-phosphate synthase
MSVLVGHPLVALIALLADRFLPEPHRHPLVVFGQYADWLDRRFNRPERSDNRNRGIWCVMAAVLPPTLVAVGLQHMPYYIGEAAGLVLLVVALGGGSLAAHGRAVARALADGDLDGARQAAGQLVSRDTHAMDETGCATATTESMLENGSDAVIGALFWFLVAGAGGVVAYRLVNTLDAMWGYRNEDYRLFGWAAARADDLLNFPPARLTALGYSLLGRRRQAARRAWEEDAPAWESANAGVVMAAGAGALGLRLGGPAPYGGARRERPWLGNGRPATGADIERAIDLVTRTAIAVVVLGLGVWALA